MVGKNLLPTIHLDYSDIVAFLVFANPGADFHTTSQQLQQFAIDIVNLATKSGKVVFYETWLPGTKGQVRQQGTYMSGISSSMSSQRVSG